MRGGVGQGLAGDKLNEVSRVLAGSDGQNGGQRLNDRCEIKG